MACPARWKMSSTIAASGSSLPDPGRAKGCGAGWCLANCCASFSRKSGKPSQSSRLQKRMIEGSLTFAMRAASEIDQVIAVLGVSSTASATRRSAGVKLARD